MAKRPKHHRDPTASNPEGGRHRAPEPAHAPEESRVPRDTEVLPRGSGTGQESKVPGDSHNVAASVNQIARLVGRQIAREQMDTIRAQPEEKNKEPG